MCQALPSQKLAYYKYPTWTLVLVLKYSRQKQRRKRALTSMPDRISKALKAASVVVWGYRVLYQQRDYCEVYSSLSWRSSRD